MCEFCREYRERVYRILERASYAWEVDHSNQYFIWEDETAENLALIEEAADIDAIQPTRATQLLLQAASAGSVEANHKLGWRYAVGHGVETNIQTAIEYYGAAAVSGSQMASIEYARHCAKAGNLSECLRTLKQRINSGFLPANYYWAWHRFSEDIERKTLLEVIHALQPAAYAGHPLAMLWFGRLCISGTLGWRKIPSGFVYVRRAFSVYLRHKD